MCLHIKCLSLNQGHHYQARLTQCPELIKDLPKSELTCENNGKIPATGYLLDRTVQEGSAGSKIQNIFCVTKPQLPVFVQATNKKASIIYKKQRLWWYRGNDKGEMTTVKARKRISLISCSHKPSNSFPTHTNKPGRLTCTGLNGIGPRRSNLVSTWDTPSPRAVANHQTEHLL